MLIINFHFYSGSYDISVNDCASNLPFMVHGVILVLYFSFCEAYCESVGHMYFDYSIPYAFGVTLICEGFGSLLYHICPSQIIFQVCLNLRNIFNLQGISCSRSKVKAKLVN